MHFHQGVTYIYIEMSQNKEALLKAKREHMIRLTLHIIPFVIIVFCIVALGFVYKDLSAKNKILSNDKSVLIGEKTDLTKNLEELNKEFTSLKSEDQYVINQELQKKVKNVETEYSNAVKTYEDLLSLKTKTKDTDKLDRAFAKSLSELSELNYTSAAATLTQLKKDIAAKEQEIASAFIIPENVQEKNTPPGSGFSRQKVSIDLGSYLVDIVSADLNSTRVIIDTASDGTCTNDCPVLSLGDYVSRSGAFAGINGSYFCPASYPSCAGKTNSFDTLLMNKNKVYFNSDNNVYSTVPVAAFGSGWARFMGRSSDWGRDTGVDGVIANQPLLVSGGNVAFGGDGDPKKGSKGSRSFIGATGTTIYIGVVHNATVAEVAHVLKAMGINDALNLDSGGSTALWSGGYKVGPGRNIPNAVLFVRR